MPAGVAVMRGAYAKLQILGSLLLRLLRTGRSDGADIAEQLIEEAALAAEGRSLAVRRFDRCDHVLARPVDGNDVARLVEADVIDGLLGDPGIAEGELVGVARDIIPVVGRKLAGERRPAERLHNRFLIVHPGLDRAGELRIDD